VFNTVIDTLCKNPTTVDEAYRLYDDFIDSANSHAYVHTHNALIRGSCVTDLFKKTFSFYEQMLFKWIKPNVYTFGLLVDCLCKQGFVNESKLLINIMLKQGLLFWLPCAQWCPKCNEIV